MTLVSVSADLLKQIFLIFFVEFCRSNAKSESFFTLFRMNRSLVGALSRPVPWHRLRRYPGAALPPAIPRNVVRCISLGPSHAEMPSHSKIKVPDFGNGKVLKWLKVTLHANVRCRNVDMWHCA